MSHKTGFVVQGHIYAVCHTWAAVKSDWMCPTDQWRSRELKSTRFSIQSILSARVWMRREEACHIDTKTKAQDFYIHLQKKTRGLWYHTAIIFHRDWKHVCWEHNKCLYLPLLILMWLRVGLMRFWRRRPSVCVHGHIWRLMMDVLRVEMVSHLKHALFNHTYVRTSRHINPDQNINQIMGRLSNSQHYS